MYEGNLRKTNVRLHGGVCDRAKELNINVSAVCRDAVDRAVREAEANRIALEVLNMTREELRERAHNASEAALFTLKKVLPEDEYLKIKAEWLEMEATANKIEAEQKDMSVRRRDIFATDVRRSTLTKTKRSVNE